jgi:hypothetical protein
MMGENIARNMYRIQINVSEKTVCQVGYLLELYEDAQSEKYEILRSNSYLAVNTLYFCYKNLQERRNKKSEVTVYCLGYM